MPISITASENGDIKVAGLGNAKVIVTFADDKTISNIEFNGRPFIPQSVKDQLKPQGLGGTAVCHKKSVCAIKEDIKKEYLQRYNAPAAAQQYISGFKLPFFANEAQRDKLARDGLMRAIAGKYITECTQGDNLFLGDDKINEVLGLFVHLILTRSELPKTGNTKILKEHTFYKGLLDYINNKKANKFTMEHGVLNSLSANCTIDEKGDCVVNFKNSEELNACWKNANNDSPSLYINKKQTTLMTSNSSSSASSSASAAPEKPPLAALTGASLSTALSSTAASCPQTAATAAQPPAQSAAISPQNTH